MLVKDFRQQINRGLGSIILFLKSNQKSNRKFTKAIIYACTHDTAYDPQSDPSKAQYLWEIIQLSEDAEFIQSQVLEALCTSKEGYDIVQMYQLAKFFGQNGSIRAGQVMKEQFRFHESWNAFIGAEEIIDLEGIEGLKFVIEAIGEKLLSCDDYWEDDLLLDFAKEKLGDDCVSRFLENEVLTNLSIKAYLKSVQSTRDERKKHQSRDRSYNDVKKVINDYTDGPVYHLGYWGRRASEEDFLLLAQDLMDEKDYKKLIPNLYIFSMKAFPLDHAKIIELAYSKNEELSTAAVIALSNIKDNRIHDIATNLVKERKKEWYALPLFVNNYEDYDYLILEDILFRNHDRHSFHNTSGLVMDILANNTVQNSLNMLIAIYKLGYCAYCRKQCIEIMIKNEIIPDWILSEAEYDSNLDIRQLVLDFKEHGV